MKIEWDFKELTDFANNLANETALNRELKFAAKEIASVLLTRIKNLTPIGDTWQLINGWNGNDFAVKEVNGGFEVLLINQDEKSLWVNDGHKAYNQYGGPYQIKHRIKVTSPYQWQRGNAMYYVFGHFFVERGILQINATDQVEQIIMKHLQKWWEKL